MILLILFLVFIAGFTVYAFANSNKLQTIGLHIFWVGLAAYLLVIADIVR